MTPIAIGVGLSPVLLGMGGAGVEYLVRDEFTTAEAAPLASPRTCEPGPGTLTVVDASNIISISGGDLVMNGNAAAMTAVIGGAQARATGRTLFCTYKRHVGIGWNHVGWFRDVALSPATAQARMWWVSTVSLNCSDLGASLGTQITVATNTTPLPTALVLRSAGTFVLAQVAGVWMLAWVMVDNNDAVLYPALSVLNPQAGIDMSYEQARVFDLGTPWDTDFGIVTQRLAGARAPGDTFTHEADCLIEFTMATAPAADQIEMRFRIQDATNYWQVTVDSGRVLDLDEVVAGVVTNRATWAGPVADGNRIAIVANGNRIEVFVITFPRIIYTAAANFNTEIDGELETEGTAGAVTDIVSWPRTLSGAALVELERYTA